MLMAGKVLFSYKKLFFKSVLVFNGVARMSVKIGIQRQRHLKVLV